MNTAMSTKRSFVSIRPHATSNSGYTLLAFIGGFVLMAIGFKLGLDFLAIIGFVPFTTALLYYNAMFWAKRYDNIQTPFWVRDISNNHYN